MARPDTPTEVDGATLPADLRARLDRLIALIWRESPDRDSDGVLAQAIGAFRLTARLVRGRWVSIPRAVLGGGTGPQVPIR